LNEAINPYKLLHDLNAFIKYLPKQRGGQWDSGCGNPIWAEANANMVKVQGYLDQDGSDCPRKPGLIYLLGGSGDCVPLVGYNSGTLLPDGDASDPEYDFDHGIANDQRELGAKMFVKF